MTNESGRARWQRAYDAAAKRDADFSTLSGLEVEPAYGPPDGAEPPDAIGWPGEFPFTRGLYPTGYRGKPWTIRQFSGFGNGRQTNERYKMLIKAGGHGLSVAFDMPTLMGRDSDDTKSLGEVGHCGVAIDSAADMDVPFDEYPAGRDDHVDDDQRPRRAGLLHVPGGRRAPGHRPEHARRDAADRHLQGVHRAEGVAVRPGAAPAAHRRPDGVLREKPIPGRSRSPSPATTSREAGSTDRAKGRRSPWPDGFDLRRELGLNSLASTSTSSPPACRSSSTRTSTSSRRSRSSAPPAASGPAGCATSTARRPPARSGCASTPRPPGCHSPLSSR